MPENDPDLVARIVGGLGIITPIFFLTGLTLVMAMAPWFDVTRYALSDMGVGVTGPFFNGLMMVGGALVTAFALYLNAISRSRELKLATGFFALSGIMLFFVGVFPKSILTPHLIVAGTFFGGAIVSQFFAAAGFLKQGLVFEGRLSLVCALGPLIVWPSWFLTGLHWSIPELIAVFFLLLWAMALSVKLIHKMELE